MNFSKIPLLIIFCSLGYFTAYTQAPKRVMTATRIDKAVDISIDGFINEEAWELASVASDFVQNEPVFEGEVSQRTEVRLLYTDRGIYVGAMMYDTQPELILKELSPRDSRGNTDWFGIVFDTYRDGLNGFSFIVTASGVQQDLKIAGGEEDVNWDGIWKSKVQFLDNGWSTEFFIPYLSLRFANSDVQKWNVQLMREVRRYREQLYWNPVDPALEGFLNQAGQLEGISDIKSPVRLSITPFVTGYINTTGDPSQDINTSVTPAYTGGMDLKYGINDAFTLDMTLIPDFGQVISDNEVLNLSPFEVRFDENRQFFKEGTELFNKGNLFYTRRVGGFPVNGFRAFTDRQPNEVLLETASQSQLINATKVSGRTSSGTGIGVFNAVEGEEYAIFQDIATGAQRSVKINPYTNYNVLVADQNLPNNSVISVINTNVTRFGEDYDANVTGVFGSFKNRAQTYAAGGKVAVANQFFDGGTNTGHTYALSVAKIGGNWTGFVDYNEESDNYNPNDLGILFSPNERSVAANISYNDYKPKNQKWQRWEVGITPTYSRLYKPNVFADFAINFNAFLLWKSRNAIGLNGRIEPIETFDYFEPRTLDFSKFYTFPTNFLVGGFFSSDYRKKLALDVRTNYRKFNESGRHYSELTFSPRIRLSDRFSIFSTTFFSSSQNETGFTSAFVGAAVEGIDPGDVMIGTRDRRIIENSVRLQYIFNNLMSISTRIRHYWDQVEYDKFGKLGDDGRLQNLNFDGRSTDGTPIYDQNFNFFTVDMMYTWRFTEGSDIIFVWKNNIRGSDTNFDANYFSNFSDLFDKQQTNSFSLKIVYFLDYDSLVNG